MQTAGIKQEEAEKEYIRCHEQTERKPHCVSEYQQTCKFQAQGRLRVKDWDTFQSRADNTEGPISSEDGDDVCATVCNGDSTGTCV